MSNEMVMIDLSALCDAVVFPFPFKMVCYRNGFYFILLRVLRNTTFFMQFMGNLGKKNMTQMFIKAIFLLSYV